MSVVIFKIFEQLLLELMSPTPKWGPANSRDRTGRYAKVRKTEAIEIIKADGSMPILEIITGDKVQHQEHDNCVSNSYNDSGIMESKQINVSPSRTGTPSLNEYNNAAFQSDK